MKTTGYYCKILADSINPDGDRLTTLHLRFPRFILAQLNTHRVLSKNAGSSRAIPNTVLCERVLNDPVFPILTSNRKGMQGDPIIDKAVKDQVQELIKGMAFDAVCDAIKLNDFNLHKQNLNRYLEPFAWVDVVLTATDWDNFFSLRIHEDAQDEIEVVAKMICIALYESNPEMLHWGSWHLPYFSDSLKGLDTLEKAEVCAARCARVSYKPFDSESEDIEKDKRLAHDLRESGHWSPFEHVSQASPGRHANFTGWKQLRKFYEKPKQFIPDDGMIQKWKQELLELIGEYHG